jgi:hypothetical protein
MFGMVAKSSGRYQNEEVRGPLHRPFLFVEDMGVNLLSCPSVAIGHSNVLMLTCATIFDRKDYRNSMKAHR